MEGQPFAELSPSKGNTKSEDQSPLERPNMIHAMSDARRRSSRLASSNINIDASLKPQAQQKPMSLPTTAPKPPAASFAGPVAATHAKKVKYSEAVYDRLVNDIMKRLQEKMDKVNAEWMGFMDAEPADIHSTLLPLGRDILRRIYAAWSRYPQAGGILNGAIITRTDYSYTAFHVAKDDIPDKKGSLGYQIASSMANFIDPGDKALEDIPDDQKLVYEQKCINSCLHALKKQYTIWEAMCHPERTMITLSEAHEEMILDPARPITYNIETGEKILHAPTTPSQMLSAKGIAASAEDEAHENVHVYVSGGKVLKTKQEKNAELNSRLAEAKTEEAKRAKDALAVKSQGTTVSRAAKTHGGKKKTVLEAEDEEELALPSVRVTINNPKRKRVAAAIDMDDAEGTEGAPAPTKRVKQMAGKGKAAVTDNKESIPTSNGSGSGAPSGSGGHRLVAPDNTKPGGAAPKWLQDEDDLAKQLICDHPDWQMPDVYRVFNAQLANTAYRATPKHRVEYRSPWVEHPRFNKQGHIINEKEARQYDICWRTYESFRQHLENHKKLVGQAADPKSITWTKLKPNLAVDLPKNPNPPRYTHFRDNLDTNANDNSSLSEYTTTYTPTPPSQLPATSRGTPTSTFQDREYHTSSGWTPINKPVTNFDHLEPPVIGHKLPHRKPKAPKAAAHPSLGVPAQQPTFAQPRTLTNPGALRSYQPAQQQNAAEERTFTDDEIYNAQYPPVEQSAPGDELYDGLEDFVMDQSDGEEEEEEKEEKAAEAANTRTYTGAEVQAMMEGLMKAQKGMEERIQQLESSRSVSPRPASAATEYDPTSPAFPPPQAATSLPPSTQHPTAATDRDGVIRTDGVPTPTAPTPEPLTPAEGSAVEETAGRYIVRLPVPGLYKGQ